MSSVIRFSEQDCLAKAKAYKMIEQARDKGISEEMLISALVKSQNTEEHKHEFRQMVKLIYKTKKDRNYSVIFYKNCMKPFYSVKIT